LRKFENGESGGLSLLFLKEESGGLNSATSSSGLCLGFFSLLNDGLEPSPNSGGVGVGRHGDRRRRLWRAADRKVAAALEGGGQEVAAARRWRRP
jgi:hypothetical protein